MQPSPCTFRATIALNLFINREATSQGRTLTYNFPTPSELSSHFEHHEIMKGNSLCCWFWLENYMTLLLTWHDCSSMAL